MAEIVDQFGRPIQRAQLTEPQTAKLGWLKSEFASHPARGLTPALLASHLEGAEQGDLIAQCELAEDMEEKDGHLLAELSKRKRAMLTLDWDIQPARDATPSEEEDAEWLKEQVLDIPDFEDLILDLLDAVSKGFSLAEIEWERSGGEWRPRKICQRPQAWFTTPYNDRDTLTLRDGPAGGTPLIPFGWIEHRHRAKSGYIARGGLVRVLAWPYLFKNYAVRDLAEFLEIYGLPLRLGKYPAGASQAERATLLQAVVNIGHAAAGIIPEGMAVEFESAAEGHHDPFVAMMDWCERTQSKAILGQVLSAEAKNTGLGSGVADLQGEVRRDLLVSDSRQLGATLSRDLLWPMLALNRAGRDPRRCPRFTFDTREPEDLALYADAIPKLVAAGFKIPVEWAHEKLRIPEPEADEPVLTVVPAVGAAPPPRSAPEEDPEDDPEDDPEYDADESPADTEARPTETAAARAVVGRASLPVRGARRESPELHPAPAQTGVLAAEAAPALGDWLDTIRALVERAETLAQLRDELMQVAGALPRERLAAVFEMAFAAAHLAGRFDAAGDSAQAARQAGAAQ